MVANSYRSLIHSLMSTLSCKENMQIACVLVTHLPVKAEIQRHPELKGKPVIVTAGNGSKQVVLDSSPEARGVAPGMTVQEALSQSKDAPRWWPMRPITRRSLM